MLARSHILTGHRLVLGGIKYLEKSKSTLEGSNFKRFTFATKSKFNEKLRIEQSYAENKGGLFKVACCIQSKTYSTQAPRPYVDPKFSYAFGKSNHSLIYSTVTREFLKQVKERPDDIAFIVHFEKRKVTFREFNQDVNKLSKALVKRFGVKKGDFVGVYAYNCYHWLVIQYACSKVGAVLAPINPSNKGGELAHILETTQMNCLFMPGPKSEQAELNDHLGALQSEEILESCHKLALKNVILMDDNNYRISTYANFKPSGDKFEINFKLPNCNLHNWSSTENDGIVFETAQEAETAGLSEEEACILHPDLVSPEDLFAVYFTSGTTGKPKGACVSQFVVLNNTISCQNRLRVGRAKNFQMLVATTLPLFHIYNGVLNTLSPTISKTTIVYTSYKYNIGQFVEAIYEHNAEFCCLTPTILIDMLSYIEDNKLTDFPMKVVQSGGAALPPEVAIRAHKLLPNLEEVRNGYGSTENGSVATFQTMHEPAETKTRSVGPPVDFTSVRIVQPNTDQVVLHGERGEVQTRGYNAMVEYLNQPEKTAEAFHNGWYRTGDIGLMFPHGSIEISGRLKHMIIKGGENIYPEEIQKLIHKLDYVEDVHVVGVPDKRFGEQICAWIKLKTGYEAINDVSTRSSSKQIHKDDVLNYCKDKITYFKVPKYILFVDSFPLTATKKVQNHIMTQRSIKLLNLEDQLT